MKRLVKQLSGLKKELILLEKDYDLIFSDKKENLKPGQAQIFIYSLNQLEKEKKIEVDRKYKVLKLWQIDEVVNFANKNKYTCITIEKARKYNILLTVNKGVNKPAAKKEEVSLPGPGQDEKEKIDIKKLKKAELISYLVENLDLDSSVLQAMKKAEILKVASENGL